MTYLIDAYNLMHAVGLLAREAPKGRLERARTRFLDWLAVASKGRPAILMVVFDAQSTPNSSPKAEYKGIQVHFSFRQTADDLIETLLLAEANPARMTVVSNDMRLQAAGHRRGSEVMTCQQFVDWLIEDSKPHALPRPENEKPNEEATEDELSAWLNAFSKPKPKTKRR